MAGIQQPVGFVWRQGGRHHKNRLAVSSRETITDRREFGRSRSLAPGVRQAAGIDPGPRYIVRYVRGSDDEVRGWVVAIEMDEVLDHRQRQML